MKIIVKDGELIPKSIIPRANELFYKKFKEVRFVQTADNKELNLKIIYNMNFRSNPSVGYIEGGAIRNNLDLHFLINILYDRFIAERLLLYAHKPRLHISKTEFDKILNWFHNPTIQK
jgi:hypothetical protein